MPPLGGFPSEYRHPGWYGKTRGVWLPDGEKILKISLFVLTQLMSVTDTHTDGHRQTPHDGIGRAYASHCAAKTIPSISPAWQLSHTQRRSLVKPATAWWQVCCWIHVITLPCHQMLDCCSKAVMMCWIAAEWAAILFKRAAKTSSVLWCEVDRNGRVCTNADSTTQWYKYILFINLL